MVGRSLTERPSRRDWLIAALLGVGIGAVVLGIGGRVAMRGIVLLSGGAPGFSIGGTATVVLLGALAGLVGAIALMLLRLALPRRPIVRGAAYWLFLVLVTLRGLDPVDLPRLLLFLPLVIGYGIGLQVLACRLRSHGPSGSTSPHVQALA